MPKVWEEVSPDLKLLHSSEITWGIQTVLHLSDLWQRLPLQELFPGSLCNS